MSQNNYINEQLLKQIEAEQHVSVLQIQAVLKLIEEGSVPVEKLITETLPLSMTEEAIIKHMNGRALKILIKP